MKKTKKTEKKAKGMIASQINLSANLYHYRAKVVRVVDGDTVDLDFDLGLKTYLHGVRVRLYGINAPEKRGRWKEKGIEAQKYLEKRILKKKVIIITTKDKLGKYGRLLGTIYFKGVNINELMVESGHAKHVKY